jgi:hypothetical protein
MFQNVPTLLTRPEAWVTALLVASFLTIYWTLRGSPPGQSTPVEDDQSAPSPRRRDLLIAGVTAGLVLIVLGAYLCFTQGVLWSIPALGLGVGLALWLNMVCQRHRHASPVLRRTAELSRLFLNAALLAGVLAVANVAAFRYGGQGIDLTREQTFSLSSRTLNQLASLEWPLSFHLLFGRGGQSLRRLDRVAQLLDLYRAASPGLIKIDSLNPYTELSRSEDLAKRAPDLGVVRGDRVLIEYGEGPEAQFMVVPAQEMFEPVPPDVSRQGSDQFVSSFKGEDAITSALIRLREGQKQKVAFITGHGEPPSADLNPSGPGIGLWKARLASVGCDPIELNLLKDAIPDDLALLIIAGPRIPFKPEELAKLKAYADRGGPVLALVGNTEPAGLDEFLRSFNVEIGRGLVIDPQLNANNVQLVYTLLKGSRGHPISDALPPDRAVLVPNGAPIRILDQGTAARGKPPPASLNANLVPVAILRTGPRSWAETDLSNPRPHYDKGVDEAGPVTVGVAVSERTSAADGVGSPKPRLVLFSSSALASNIVQGIEPTNMDLVMNAASWLRGRPDTVGISASTHVALMLTADPLLRNRLVVVPTVMATLAIIAAGLIVFVARRE